MYLTRLFLSVELFMLPTSTDHHESTLPTRRKHYVNNCIYRALVNILVNSNFDLRTAETI
jgi:hypothetical protein